MHFAHTLLAVKVLQGLIITNARTPFESSNAHMSSTLWIYQNELDLTIKFQPRQMAHND